jgi:hypothetical protein
VDRKKDGEQARGGVYRREGGVCTGERGCVYRELVRPAAIAPRSVSTTRGDGRRCRIKT